MRLDPARVHGYCDERRSVYVSRDDPGGSDRSNAADGDLVLACLAYRTDLLEPLDLDTVRQLHHYRPAVVQPLESTLVPTRVPDVRVPVFRGTSVHAAGNVGRRARHLLQQRHVCVHPHKLTPRLVPFTDVPAHYCDGHIILRIGFGAPGVEQRWLPRSEC